MSLLLSRLSSAVTGRVLKYWTGSSWGTGTLKYWDGDEWKEKSLKYWNGSDWV